MAQAVSSTTTRLMCLRCLTARILDCNLAGLARLSSADLNLDMVTQRGQKAHQPFKRNLSELSSQDFRQLGLGGSDAPCCDALRQPQRLDRFVQAEDKFGLEIMLFSIRKSELQPDIPCRIFGCRCFGHHDLSFPLGRRDEPAEQEGEHAPSPAAPANPPGLHNMPPHVEKISLRGRDKPPGARAPL